MKFIIADDHAVVRRGLNEILKDAFGPDCATEASNGREVLQLVKESIWDLVILDVSMPGLSGLDVLRSLRLSHPQLPVLLLSVHPEEQYAIRAIRAGAAGYLTKEHAPEELVAAIRKVLGGGKFVSSSLAQSLANNVADGSPAGGHAALSNREFEVLRMLASGDRVTGIAEKLCRSAKTISTHRTRILQKLKLESTAQLIRYALENKLLA